MSRSPSDTPLPTESDSSSRAGSSKRSQPAETLIQLNSVGYAFGNREAIADISFSVRQGECFGVLGPNGSGKSTVMGILAGMLIPHQGSVIFEGRKCRAHARALRQKSGVVFQSPSLDLKLSARQNLSLSAQIWGINRRERAVQIRRAIELAELTDRPRREAITALSGGMRRRLDIARALLHNPALLLMDEPTSGLDEKSFRALWHRLDRLRHERALTVLLATHRVEEADRCDRIAVLNGGRLIRIGTPESLRREVAQDALIVTPTDTNEVREICERISSELAVPCFVDGNHILAESRIGHRLIPRVIELFPSGKIASISLRRASLADAFLKITGNSLGFSP